MGALALRVSMEEQRQRQTEEERRVAAESGETPMEGAAPPAAPATPKPPTAAPEGGASEEEMLQQALAMSMEGGGAATTESKPPTAAASASAVPPVPATPQNTGNQRTGFPVDFSSMTEEEQIAYAMQISMQDCQPKEEAMDVDAKAPKKEPKKEEEQDFSEVMADPAFLESVLQNLPGVDPQSQAVKEAVGSLTKQEDKDNKDDKDKK